MVKALFWQPLKNSPIRCGLCYRRCAIGPGHTGWCGARRNQGGQLELIDAGTVAMAQVGRRSYAPDSFPTFEPGARYLVLGGLRCNSGCTFCANDMMAHHPEALPWLQGPALPEWVEHRTQFEPAAAVAWAVANDIQHVTLAGTEPLLTFEYSLAVARLARAAGLKVTVATNGFSTPAAVAELGQYVDAVAIGIKASCDGQFYRTYMHAPGGDRAVLASIEAWQAADVSLTLTDLIAPLTMQTDADCAAAQSKLYGWLADHLGPAGFVLSPIPMVDQAQHILGGEGYFHRMAGTIRRAQSCGLAYVAGHPRGADRFYCHRCGALLLALYPPEDAGNNLNHPEGWRHEIHTIGNHCQGCGATVPVVAT